VRFRENKRDEEEWEDMKCRAVRPGDGKEGYEE